jgi:hypothetical protein
MNHEDRLNAHAERDEAIAAVRAYATSLWRFHMPFSIILAAIIFGAGVFVGWLALGHGPSYTRVSGA